MEALRTTQSNPTFWNVFLPGIGEKTMSTTEKSQSFAFVPRIMNGGFAGIVGVTCVFPIDLVKTRLQNQRIGPSGIPQYTGISDCAKQTWRNGGKKALGKIGSMYAGSAVNLILITPEKAVKLVTNDFLRHCLAVPGQSQLSVWRGMIAGGGAGLCQVIVTTPMELLKIQMQDAGRTTVVDPSKRITAIGLTMDLLRTKGIGGLYKGIGPTMARDVSFSVVYFPFFAYLDSLGPRSNDGSGKAVFYASFIAGLISAAFSSLIVTPLDVVKTRLQLIKHVEGELPYGGIMDAFSKLLQNEGPKALFKGGACRMMVMAPLFGIAQMVYFFGVAEFCLNTLNIRY